MKNGIRLNLKLAKNLSFFLILILPLLFFISAGKGISKFSKKIISGEIFLKAAEAACWTLPVVDVDCDVDCAGGCWGGSDCTDCADCSDCSCGGPCSCD